jgi:hypothetical protein
LVISCSHHQLFAALVVHAERTARDDDLDAFRTQLFDRVAHRSLIDHVGGEEAMSRTQMPPGRKLDLLDGALAAREQRFDAARHADHADCGDVAFEQRIGGLRRAVSEEDHIGGRNPGALEHVAEHFDDALRDAARIAVRGEHGVALHHLERLVVDQHRFGEGAADVDADAVGFGWSHESIRGKAKACKHGRRIPQKAQTQSKSE